MLSSAEHEKSFITSGPGHCLDLLCFCKCMQANGKLKTFNSVNVCKKLAHTKLLCSQMFG